MTFCFDKKEESITIKHWTVDMEAKTITREFLDGTEDVIPYSDENLEKITNIACEQAAKRDKESEKKLYRWRDYYKYYTPTIISLDAVAMLANTYRLIKSDVIKEKIYSAMFIILFAYFICRYIVDKMKYTRMSNELEKYDEFLTLQTEYENYGITINDLDNYSLDQIKDIGAEMNEAAKTKKLV